MIGALRLRRRFDHATRDFRVLSVLAALAASRGADAQWGGDEGHSGAGRGHGGGHQSPSASDQGAPPPHSHAAPEVAPDQVVISGVVTGLGPQPDRVTIAYGAVDALNWPAGSTPFVVANPTLLDGIKVGQKVKFKIESAHIYELDRVS